MSVGHPTGRHTQHDGVKVLPIKERTKTNEVPPEQERRDPSVLREEKEEKLSSRIQQGHYRKSSCSRSTSLYKAGGSTHINRQTAGSEHVPLVPDAPAVSSEGGHIK